jgi:DNA polymerase III delta subunit
MSIVLLYGESLPEPYCIDMRKRSALKEVNTEGMNYTSMRGKFDSNVAALARTVPMLEEKRGIVLEIDTLKDLDNRDFEEYISKPAPFTELVIICREADKRLKVYKKLAGGGIKGVEAVLCDKKEVTRDKLIQTVRYELKSLGASMDKEAQGEFLRRINYDGIKDMTLLTMAGYIHTLAAVSGGEITKSLVEEYVPAFKEPNEFLLVSLLIRKDMAGLIEQVNMVSPKDTIGILCLALRSYRMAWKEKFFNDPSCHKENGLADYDIDTLKKCIGIINETIKAIKTGFMPEDMALKVACSRLTVAMSQ